MQIPVLPPQSLAGASSFRLRPQLLFFLLFASSMLDDENKKITLFAQQTREPTSLLPSSTEEPQGDRLIA
jgi:hypothetical protein